VFCIYRNERLDGRLERGLRLAAVAVELAECDLLLHQEDVALGPEHLRLEPPLLQLPCRLPSSSDDRARRRRRRPRTRRSISNGAPRLTGDCAPGGAARAPRPGRASRRWPNSSLGEFDDPLRWWS